MHSDATFKNVKKKYNQDILIHLPFCNCYIFFVFLRKALTIKMVYRGAKRYALLLQLAMKNANCSSLLLISTMGPI